MPVIPHPTSSGFISVVSSGVTGTVGVPSSSARFNGAWEPCGEWASGEAFCKSWVFMVAQRCKMVKVSVSVPLTAPFCGDQRFLGSFSALSRGWVSGRASGQCKIRTAIGRGFGNAAAGGGRMSFEGWLAEHLVLTNGGRSSWDHAFCLTCEKKPVWRRGRGKYCSQRCFGIAKRSSQRDFWKYVHEDSNGCWLWHGLRTERGYGVVTYHGLFWRAHRLAWTLVYGPIAKGLVICHSCDTPSCVRPDHLFVGTQKQNIQDAVSKGRMLGSLGERNGMSKTKRSERAARFMVGVLHG